MRKEQAEMLIQVVNTIEAQRDEQTNPYLTEPQAGATVALLKLLKAEGFEVHRRLTSRNAQEFYISEPNLP